MDKKYSGLTVIYGSPWAAFRKMEEPNEPVEPVIIKHPEPQKASDNAIIKNVNGVSFYMTPVTGGDFFMGDKSEIKERPIHKVSISDFQIGVYQVTQLLWNAVMGGNMEFENGEENLPKTGVSWNDIMTFIEKLNKITGEKYRLPSEAEWEFAARGACKSQNFKYSGNNNVDEVAWTKNNSEGYLHSVGAKNPNELGIYDMSGNVWEWCQDWYSPYTSNPSINPQGPLHGAYKIVRGGSWNNNSNSCRVSFRSKWTPDYHCDDLGFRLVL